MIKELLLLLLLKALEMQPCSTHEVQKIEAAALMKSLPEPAFRIRRAEMLGEGDIGPSQRVSNKIGFLGLNRSPGLLLSLLARIVFHGLVLSTRPSRTAKSDYSNRLTSSASGVSSLYSSVDMIVLDSYLPLLRT